MAADVRDDGDTTFVPVDLWSFVGFCTVAAETFNQRQATPSAGVSRDYILALALVLNGLEETGLTDDLLLQGFDPFHFTEAEWTGFCTSSGNLSRYQGFDRFDPLAQIDAGVFFTFGSASEIARSLTNPVDVGGPYIANTMDLFLVHMLGPAAGVAALKDLAIDSGSGPKPWTGFVSAAGGDIVALKIRYPKFLAAIGMTSVQDVLDLIENAFDKAYVNVAKIVPATLPEVHPAGEPPKWLEFARSEEQKNVTENDPRFFPRILEYFTATDLHTQNPHTAWCAAFAAFCMENSNEPPPPAGAALAATWGVWGQPLRIGAPADKIPLGAVVVFSPKKGVTGVHGHVAFFVSGDQSTVQVLGGNQSHAVNTIPFKRSRIVHIRWPADVAVPSGTEFPGGEIAIGIGPLNAVDWEKYKDVLGNRESGNNYSGPPNRFGFCGRWQFGAPALADVGYVHIGRKTSQLGNPGSWTGKDGIKSRDMWLNNHPVQDNAMLLFTRLNFNRLVSLRVINPDDSKPRVAGFLAAAHLGGVQGAQHLANGVVHKDPNGTTTAAYFNLFTNAFA